MAQFILVYLGGDKPSSPEQGQQHFTRYMQWLSNLGEAVVSPMNPIKDTCTLDSDGSVRDGGTTTMSGYTVVEADSMQAALALAKSCPFLEIGGSLEVSELVEMPAQKQA